MNSLMRQEFPIPLTWREKLAYLAVRFEDGDVPEMPVTHKWTGGKYIREIHIPKDTVFIGARHRHGHECILASGHVLHIREHDEHERKAPFTMHTVPNCQMVLRTFTDVVGVTIHPDSGERDTKKCWDEHFFPVDEEFALGRQIRAKLDHLSYEALLERVGINEQLAVYLFKDGADLIEFPESGNVSVGASAIHGKGIIADVKIPMNEWICDARIGNNRTPAGRYTNHSHDPNAIPVIKDGCIGLYAVRPIAKNAEVTVDYMIMALLAIQLGAS